MKIPLKVSTNSIYAGVHWTKRKAMKDIYIKSMLPFRKLRAETPCHLHFEFSFRSKALDSSNCSYMGKMLEDCMKEYGIIPDDKPKYITGVSYYSKKGLQDQVTVFI